MNYEIPHSTDAKPTKTRVMYWHVFGYDFVPYFRSDEGYQHYKRGMTPLAHGVFQLL